MPRMFYTEKDIEDMFKSGIMSLEVGDNVALTELAYEKARSMGVRLVRDAPENPPSAPVRPYLSMKAAKVRASPAPAPVHDTSVLPAVQAASAVGGTEVDDLRQRIRSAVVARLGTKVDSNLLDVIISRVLNSTGLKETGCCSAESVAQLCAQSNAGAPRG